MTSVATLSIRRLSLLTQSFGLLFQPRQKRKCKYLSRQSSQRFRKNQRPACYIVDRCILVRPVAVAVAARDEQHCDARDARHEKRIVVRAADHSKISQLMFCAGLREHFDYRGRALSRG